MEGCGSRCIKYLLIVFNGLFMIFGIVLIATACVDMSMIQGVADMQTGHETDAVLIAVGVLIIIVAAFGCFGAWRESPKLLYIFVGLLIIIILLELSVGIAAAALRPQIEDSLKSNLRKSFINNKSYREEDNDYRVFWDRIQSNLQCCGITGPENYNVNDRNQGASQPTYSCCPPDNSDKTVEIKRSDCLAATAFYKEGCEDKLLNTIHSAGLTVIVCGILFCFLEMLLQELVRERVNIIENKNTDTNSNKRKLAAWADLQNSFDSMRNGAQRTVAQLKSQWGSIKISEKKKFSAAKKHRMATGGGPPPREEPIDSNDIRAWLPQEFEDDRNEFDSDSVYHQVAGIVLALWLAHSIKTQGKSRETA